MVLFMRRVNLHKFRGNKTVQKERIYGGQKLSVAFTLITGGDTVKPALEYLHSIFTCEKLP